MLNISFASITLRRYAMVAHAYSTGIQSRRGHESHTLQRCFNPHSIYSVLVYVKQMM